MLKNQQEIVLSIARALQITMGDSWLSASGTKDPEAYDHFLRGSNAYDRVDKYGLREAVTDLQQALAIDPSFTRGAEALALTHSLQANNGYVPSKIGFELVRRDAEHLISANPHSELGHATDFHKRRLQSL